MNRILSLGWAFIERILLVEALPEFAAGMLPKVARVPACCEHRDAQRSEPNPLLGLYCHLMHT